MLQLALRAVAPVLLAAAALPAQTVKLTAACADAEIAEHGLVCDEDEPCIVELELSSIEPVGSRVFIAGNFHVGPSTLASVLLASDDRGVKWYEAAPRLKGVALYQVQFIDFTNGWVAGHEAGTLPRDPFLLRTADSGKTWKRLPVFADSAVGVVEQFWFETKDIGYLIAQRRGGGPAGRYLKYETRNGGDGWMLRETSDDPIAGKRPRNATQNAPDWRIRAEAKSKTLRVERREASRWTSVAVFALETGTCRPSPPKPPTELPSEPAPAPPETPPPGQDAA